jgi:putative tryptophan/tyrosine transport system substrate-binding protein
LPESLGLHCAARPLQLCRLAYTQSGTSAALFESGGINSREIEAAFESLVRERVDALQLGVDGVFGTNLPQIVALAARYAIPTIYPWREFTAAGGLMNYGTNIPDAFREVGVYTGKILKGENPADLPVWRPTDVRFVINLKTANALGLTVPPALLALADEVIE